MEKENPILTQFEFWLWFAWMYCCDEEPRLLKPNLIYGLPFKDFFSSLITDFEV